MNHGLSWNVTDEHRATVVEFVTGVLEDETASARDKNRVSQLALAMNAQNIALAKLATPDVLVNVDAPDPEEAKRIANELRQDPEYLEFLRMRLVKEHANASS